MRILGDGGGGGGGGTLDPVGKQVFYQLRCANDEAMSLGLITYDPQTSLHTEILMPNSFKFWQLRSQYPNSAWNAWQPFTDPSTCGPIQVWSGLVTKVGLVNQSMSYVGSTPISQDGTTTKILVAAKTWKAGGQLLSYEAGSVDPGSYGLWQIYAADPARKGGAVLYQASPNSSDVTGDDYNVWFGFITTSSGGGGTGGGGGAGGGGGGCVTGDCLIRMFDGTQQLQKDIRVGDVLLGTDGGPEVVQSVTAIAAMPCFALEFDQFTTHPMSATHAVKYDSGPMATLFEVHAGDSLRSFYGPWKLLKKIYAGALTVYAMVLSRSKTFYADDVACHNMNKL